MTYVFEPGAPTLVDGRFVIDLDTTRSHAIHHEAMGWLSRGHYVISLMTRRLFRAPQTCHLALPALPADDLHPAPMHRLTIDLI